MPKVIAAMISSDGRQTITVSEEGAQRTLMLTGPDVLTGQFTLNMDLQTAQDVGHALLDGLESDRD